MDAVVTKKCCVCGVDVGRRRRTRDPRGKYYCQPCYQTLYEAHQRRLRERAAIEAEATTAALLMERGLAYDSDGGRGYAAAISALMTGEAYAQSARVAAQVGTYEDYPKNREAHIGVMEMHRRAVLGYEEQQLDDTGAVVRSFRKYSDNLLLALARKRIAGFATTANVQLSGDLRSTVAVDGASLAEAVRKVAVDLRCGLQQLAASERNRLAEDVAACG